MPQLQIPHLGQKLVLVAPWTFPLHKERRNDEFQQRLGLDDPDPINTWEGYGTHTWVVTIPMGVVLKVDRIYITRNADFNSVTFRIVRQGKSDRFIGRFWAKLADVNRIWMQMLLPDEAVG